MLLKYNWLRIAVIAILIASCSDGKREYAAIATGFGEDPDAPRQAIEVNDLGNYFYYNSLHDTLSYFGKGRLSPSDTRNLFKFVKEHKTSMSRVDTFMLGHLAKVELYWSGDELHGYSYIGDEMAPGSLHPDSVSRYFIMAESDKNCEIINYHKFRTSVQLENLPWPPILHEYLHSK